MYFYWSPYCYIFTRQSIITISRSIMQTTMNAESLYIAALCAHSINSAELKLSNTHRKIRQYLHVYDLEISEMTWYTKPLLAEKVTNLSHISLKEAGFASALKGENLTPLTVRTPDSVPNAHCTKPCANTTWIYVATILLWMWHQQPSEYFKKFICFKK